MCAKKSPTAKAGKKSAPESSSDRMIAENRKARHRFLVLDTLECGIELVGSEVKSLRQGKLSLDESYAQDAQRGGLAGGQ